MGNVLVLGQDFPPKNTIVAQRPYSWFKYNISEIELELLLKNPPKT